MKSGNNYMQFFFLMHNKSHIPTLIKLKLNFGSKNKQIKHMNNMHYMNFENEIKQKSKKGS